MGTPNRVAKFGLDGTSLVDSSITDNWVGTSLPGPLTLGLLSAQSGMLRLPNNQAITARNAGNSGDINLFKLGSDNYIQPGTHIILGNDIVIGSYETGGAARGLIRLNGSNQVEVGDRGSLNDLIVKGSFAANLQLKNGIALTGNYSGNNRILAMVDGTGKAVFGDPNILTIINMGNSVEGAFSLEKDNSIQYWNPNTNQWDIARGIRIRTGNSSSFSFVDTTNPIGGGFDQFYIRQQNIEGGNAFHSRTLFKLDDYPSLKGIKGMWMFIKSTAVGVPDSGDIQVTGLGINIESPVDTGGDSSGIYVRQAGGGNGISVFKESATYPNNGFAIEAGASSGATAIYAFASTGDVLKAKLIGNGQGVNVRYPTGSSGSNRALRVAIYDPGAPGEPDIVEKFFVQDNGNMYMAGRVQGDLLPLNDNGGAVGNATYRWNLVRAVNIIPGDLGFEELTCSICKHSFHNKDILTLIVKQVDIDHIKTIPVHLKCI